MSSVLRFSKPIPSLLRQYSTKKKFKTEKERLLKSIETKSEYFWSDYFFFSHKCRVEKRTPRKVLSRGELSLLVNTIQNDPDILYKSADSFAEYDCIYSTDVRCARSGITFLYEDIINDEQSLHLPWRQFCYSPDAELRMLEDTLHRHYPSNFLPEWLNEREDVDIRAVPKSHNFWTDLERYCSQRSFGKSIVKAHFSDFPIVPEIAVKETRDKFSQALGSFRYSNNLNDGLTVLSTYFDFSTECRRLNKHPLTTFKYCILPAFSISVVISHFDEILLTEELNKADPRKLRSAVDFMGKEIIPHMAECQKPWKEFLNGLGIKKLEKMAAKEPKHGREQDYEVPDFLTYFDDQRKILLCSMETIFVAKKEEQNLPRKVEIFLKNYFKFAKLCRRHEKIPWEVISSSEKEEFHRYFPTVIFAMDQSLQFAKEANLKIVRSAIEFLKEDLPPMPTLTNELWRQFLISDAFKEFTEKVRRLDDETMQQDIRGVNIRHDWWTTADRKNSDFYYGTSAWDIDPWDRVRKWKTNF